MFPVLNGAIEREKEGEHVEFGILQVIMPEDKDK